MSTGGQRVGAAGHFVLSGGHLVSAPGQRVAHGGHRVSAVRHLVSAGGHLVSVGGHFVSPGGHAVSAAGHFVFAAGQTVSIAWQRVGIWLETVAQGGGPGMPPGAATAVQEKRRTEPTATTHNHFDMKVLPSLRKDQPCTAKRWVQGRSLDYLSIARKSAAGK